MKLYLLVNDKDSIKDVAFTNEDVAIQHCANYINEDWHIREIELDFIGKYVYYCTGYYGFNYDFCRGLIYDVIKTSDIFSNIAVCKKCSIWQDAMASTKNKIVSEYEIKALNQFGDPFIYGDVMDQLFNVRICKIRVYKYK